MKMNKTLVFDMDGTIAADLYNVMGWLGRFKK